MSISAMIDLETLGTHPDTVILTMGGVKFDPFSGKMFESQDLYLKPDVDEQLASGRSVTDSTVEWWGKQPATVMNEAMSSDNRISVEEFVDKICKFMVGVDLIWSQGVVFDIGILENLFRSVGRPVPWSWSKVRDSRTLLSALGDTRKFAKDESHNAYYDCKNQAEAIINVVERYNLEKL